MTLLEIKETDQTRFYERTAKLRKEHEDALDRLESKLFTIQQRRETRAAREAQRPPFSHSLSALETAIPWPSMHRVRKTASLPNGPHR